jgi:hypothetical protein
MENLNIIEVVIEDSLNQLAKTCTLTLAPASAENPPVAEFGYPGDTMQQGGTALRPNGAFIDIIGEYGGLPPQILFRGSIDTMDDLEDPDQMTYKIVLTNIPRGFPHKQRRSTIWSNNEPKTEHYKIGTLNSDMILANLCGKLGITLARNDIPHYDILGTYEANQQTAIDIAQSLADPFNQSDHEKYFPRMDMNGLSIIRVNYGENTESPYALTQELSKQASYQAYIPEKALDGDVLLVGGDVYSGAFTEPVEPEGETGTPHDYISIVTATHTYVDDSRSLILGSDEAGGTSGSVPSAGDSYTIKTTEIQFNVEVHSPTPFSFKAFYPDTYELFILGATSKYPDIYEVIDAAKAGNLTEVNILDSFPFRTVEENYLKLHGKMELMTRTTTDVTYTKMRFADTTVVVPTYECSVREAFGGPRGVEAVSMTRSWPTYDNLGNTVGNAVKTYMFDRGWVLQKVDSGTGDNIGITNSQIQYYLRYWKKLFPGLVKPTDYKVISGPDTPRDTITTPTSMDTYKLLNGEVLKQSDLGTTLDIEYNGTNVGSYAIDSHYTEMIKAMRFAITVNCPGMNLEGLLLVWAQILEAREYQTGGYYWHNVTCSYSLDTTPVVGESVKTGGATGICESYRHTINADEALTEVTMKRIAKK